MALAALDWSERHGVCIEVILAHARGTADVLRAPNANGETPFDIAAALDDDNELLWALKVGERRRRQRYSDGDGRGLKLCSGDVAGGQEAARRVNGMDFERIMAVWEKFFENAAAACGRWDGCSPGVSPAIAGEETRQHRPARRPEDSGWWKIDDQPRTARLCREDDGQPAMSTRGGRKGEDLKAGEAGDGRHCDDRNDLSHAEVTSTTPRYCGWTSTPPHLERDREVEDVDGESAGELVPKQPKEDVGDWLGGEQHEILMLSSHDADLHLFHTPREDDNNDGDTAWWSAPSQAEIHSSPKPPTPETKAVADPPGAMMDVSNPHREQEAWVACWDASSESIYYWSSESGEVAWDAPSCAVSGGEGTRPGFPSRVWDPQEEGFFTVDEGGVSHWLASSTSPTPEIERQMMANSVADTSQVRCSNEQDNLGEDDHDIHRFYDAEERSSRRIGACSPHANAGRVFTFESADDPRGGRCAAVVSSERHPRPSSWQGAEASTSVAEKENPGQENTSDVVDCIDTETCRLSVFRAVVKGDAPSNDDLRPTEIDPSFSQLPAWVMWCAHSRDEDALPYFVNEETCTSSWVLPPEAVVASRGWLRAWSEEHQAWFYTNHWTGRVTWVLQDLEHEGWSAAPDD